METSFNAYLDYLTSKYEYDFVGVILITFPSLKRVKNVGSVGCVGKSEKSPQEIQ